MIQCSLCQHWYDEPNPPATKRHQMSNECNRLAPQVIDCASAPGVHIAGVTGSSPVPPTKQKQVLTDDGTGQDTVANVGKRYEPRAGREFWPDERRGNVNATRHECEQIRRLFHSWDQGRGVRNYYEQLEPLYVTRLRGGLAIKPVRIPSPVLAAADRARAHRRRNRSLTASHEYLREIGLAWLSQRGVKERAIREEYRTYGYRYDLAALDPRIIVECGNTNADSAIYALMDKPEWEYWLLPFSRAADVWFRGDGEPRVYAFRLWLIDPAKRLVQDEDGVNIFPWFADEAFPALSPCTGEVR